MAIESHAAGHRASVVPGDGGLPVLGYTAQFVSGKLTTSRERFDRSVQHYHDFLDACERGSGKRAEAVIHRSIRWALDLVLETLPSEAER